MGAFIKANIYVERVLRTIAANPHKSATRQELERVLWPDPAEQKTAKFRTFRIGQAVHQANLELKHIGLMLRLADDRYSLFQRIGFENEPDDPL
jgi:hypothetical protein